MYSDWILCIYIYKEWREIKRGKSGRVGGWRVSSALVLCYVLGLNFFLLEAFIKLRTNFKFFFLTSIMPSSIRFFLFMIHFLERVVHTCLPFLLFPYLYWLLTCSSVFFFPKTWFPYLRKVAFLFRGRNKKRQHRYSKRRRVYTKWIQSRDDLEKASLNCGKYVSKRC